MRLIIVSNRLPVTLENDCLGATFKRSIGGLVTGIGSYLSNISKGLTPFDEYLWVGWPGAEVSLADQPHFLDHCIKNNNYCPVFLEEEMVRQYYYEFCNRTIWPLFHYFPHYVSHDPDSWGFYRRANRAFYLTLKKHLHKDDVVWIQDYHLMLLPQMIREDFPDVSISFFLHIPFPGFDILRHLSRHICSAILEGLLGADLIGFHTHAYSQDFLQCLSTILNISSGQNEIIRGDRLVKTGVFPMGIDYKAIQEVSNSERCTVLKEKIVNEFVGRKLILSIDRLDYTKGIPNRLIAFDRFLNKFPEWREKIVLMLLVAPSRREIGSYQEIKRSIDELVGNINGSYSTHNWTPVMYQYRQFDLTELCAVYGASDIALVTPLRDGMNLIAKEFIAAHTDHSGVLILSEMAGATHELKEAIAVNPFNIDEIVDALHTGLYMSKKDRSFRNKKMLTRLQGYDVEKWANDIMRSTLANKIVFS